MILGEIVVMNDGVFVPNLISRHNYEKGYIRNAIGHENPSKEAKIISHFDVWEVQQAISNLTMFVSIEAQEYIQDGILHSKLTHCVGEYGKTLIYQMECNIITKTEVLAKLDKEQKDIRGFNLDTAIAGFGLYGSVSQIITGLSMLALVLSGVGVALSIVLIVVGTGLILHGLNNGYEGVKFFYDQDADATGFLRSLYQKMAGPIYGDIAFYSMDIVFSLLALKLPTKNLRLTPNEGMIDKYYSPNLSAFPDIPHPLFGVKNSERLIGLENSTKVGLGAEVTADAISGYKAFKKYQSIDNQE